ncbi:RidA family protein [Novosphingobium sp. MD-1]|uniref:RidA family protein n=1 Tax=Novosphingobium sp. MD-1 TaxID=1630648 RepID=UPI00061C8DB2|nr:RidA family protein [Novosphingobium sp. MD-1]GAO53527.1 translation initiation inhibitor [Novosphingobium sp. MD-1]
MADIKRFAANPRMSGAVVQGGVAYLSGQVAIDHRGGAVADQVTEVLRRIDDLLVETGSDRSRLLTATILLADLATLPELNAAWDRWIVPGCAPTRTTLQAILASPAYALEIVVTAAVD